MTTLREVFSLSSNKKDCFREDILIKFFCIHIPELNEEKGGDDSCLFNPFS